MGKLYCGKFYRGIDPPKILFKTLFGRIFFPILHYRSKQLIIWCKGDPWKIQAISLSALFPFIGCLTSYLIKREVIKDMRKHYYEYYKQKGVNKR